MNIAVLDVEGNISPWRIANPELTILQWNHVIPIEPGEERETNYGLYDLLTDYGQTRYVIQLIGRGAPGTQFVKFFWVTPAGVSNESVDKPPIRANRETAEWSDEDSDALLAWINEHEYGHTYFLREFRGLLKKTDKKVEVIVGIKGSTCQEQGENSNSCPA